MVNVFLITKDEETKQTFNSLGYNLKVSFGDNFETLYDKMTDFAPDVAVLDSCIENSDILLMGLLGKNITEGFEVFYLTEPDFREGLEDKKIKIILKPLNERILTNEINSSFENKARIRGLHLENMELKKNLYQIDAFYNASSKFAGTLDKEKLYEVMFETFERVLSFDMAIALVNDNFEKEKLKFYIHTLKKTTGELNNALIKRLSLTAKNEGMKELKPNRYDVCIVQNTKPSYKNKFFDISVTDFDTLYAPVIIKDKFEGIIEIFRKNPFTKEDVTCFQSIVHQVLAPLRSAILYEEIINANIKLKKLERIKSEFVSIVSHELRTPLTPINNALSIILSEQGGKIGEINKNFANIAKRNVSRLSGIIEDLLDLSRMQTGKFYFNFKKTEIYPSLELALNTFKNQAQNKNIELELKKEDNLKEVYIDPHRIDQILSNLITNAIKFTPEGGKISIEASSVRNVNVQNLICPSAKEYKGEYVKISVKDTGVGIEAGDIPKIFDKFSQIENTLSRNSGGIGLGLTITKHFIDAHLGGSWVDSQKNEGSDFNVIIPVYSPQTAFEAELNLNIKNESEMGYLKIIENNNLQVYQALKDLNIIKLTKESKELIYTEDGKRINRVFIPGLDKNAFEFMVSKIEDYINSSDSNCDIVLSKAYYKKENS